MIALPLLVFLSPVIFGVLAGLILERRADEDAARLSNNLPQQERRRLTISENP